MTLVSKAAYRPEPAGRGRSLVRSASFAIRSLLAFVLLAAWTHTALAAPVGSGAGVVKDATGAVIPNARVTLQRISTNAVLSSATDATGSFQFRDLAPDVYRLTIEAPGFKRTTL